MYKLIFFFFFLQLSAQSFTSGSVLYRIEFGAKDLDKSKIPANVLKVGEKLQSDSKNLKYCLDFNQHCSHFYSKTSLEDTDMNVIKILFSNKDFYNINGTTYEETEDVLVVKDTINDWQLFNESKRINDYLCYKAVSVLEYITYKGKKISTEVVAWYSPFIPLSHGPKGYGGLPGLILELQSGPGMFYIAEQVNFIKDIKISLPNKKIISD